MAELIVCPKCGGTDIRFGRDFTVYRYWDQLDGIPAPFYEYEDGDYNETDGPIEFLCLNPTCGQIWVKEEGFVGDYHAD